MNNFLFVSFLFGGKKFETAIEIIFRSRNKQTLRKIQKRALISQS
jgi:hypothetical protein